MTGHLAFKDLVGELSPERRAIIDAKVAALRDELTLAELRQARKLTQEQMSATLNVGQAAVAKMEKRVDMYVSSLRGYVKALGGELEVVAKFPEGDVVISNFAAIGSPDAA
ncbi:hypothetical protein MMA231_02116 [Asticcacaulis sp. MM231]|uniref:XRE family transcriptional regulator n=1 Tax=Asticcacaulis sp. MM231 TaxID=3157666 RepID=UPI0032D5861E